MCWAGVYSLDSYFRGLPHGIPGPQVEYVGAGCHDHALKSCKLTTSAPPEVDGAATPVEVVATGEELE